MYLGVTLLCLIVAALSYASIHGALKFRKLTKNIRERGCELPLAAELNQEINVLRATLWQCESPKTAPGAFRPFVSEQTFPRYQFLSRLRAVDTALNKYLDQLSDHADDDSQITDTTLERKLADDMRQTLKQVFLLVQQPDWDFGRSQYLCELEDALESLQANASRLPTLMKDRMDEFAESARGEYHTWMIVTTVMTSLGIVALAALSLIFHRSIFRPLQVLLHATRQIAAGRLDYRVQLPEGDEMAELAEAFNDVTSKFLAINRDLNRQVQQRTKEVVRNEQLASVGFLAAGVAHEINNPLATIAWSAEAMEMRILELFPPQAKLDDAERSREIEKMKKYLRQIQDEAFRCKGITSGLLDFARLEDAKKTRVNLREIVQKVIDLVSPLGSFRHRRIEFEAPSGVYVEAHHQEIKQVVMNLITNALYSVDEGGLVRVTLATRGDQAELSVADNGCGMTPEVMEHLFEPFFTRRRNGQGTGLGLSISYRIVEEHGGQIEPFSAGPGLGSTFRITLPIATRDEQKPIPLAA